MRCRWRRPLNNHVAFQSEFWLQQSIVTTCHSLWKRIPKEKQQTPKDACTFGDGKQQLFITPHVFSICEQPAIHPERAYYELDRKHFRDPMPLNCVDNSAPISLSLEHVFSLAHNPSMLRVHAFTKLVYLWVPSQKLHVFFFFFY